MSHDIPPATGSRFIVSLHDVAPPTREACQAIIERLRAEGVHRWSCLVIPNYRGAHPIDQDDAFVDWLKSLQAADVEMVLHAYTHTAEQLPRGPVRRLMATMYTNREGEFYDLDREESERRIRLGLEMFARCGLHGTGFIAPAWLLGAQAREAAKACGLRYTTLLRSVVHLPSGRALNAPTCVYSVRAAWRRAVSLRYIEWLSRRIVHAPVVRLALHPADLQHPAIMDHALRVLERLRQGHELVAYEDLLPMLEAAPAALPFPA